MSICLTNISFLFSEMFIPNILFSHSFNYDYYSTICSQIYIYIYMITTILQFNNKKLPKK